MLSLPERLLFAIILAGFIYFCVQRTILLTRLLKMSAPDPDNRKENLAGGIKDAVLDVFLQRQVLRKPVTGFFHLLIVWGFFIFAVNTINHFTGAFWPGFHLFGNTVLAHWYSAVADLFAVLIIAGVVGLAIRRHVFRPPNLTRPSYESVLVFACIGGAMAAYLWANASEIALGGAKAPEYHWVASRIAVAFAAISPTPMLVMAHIAWWADALMHLALVGLLVIPTKHLHLVAGPVNLALPRPYPRGRLAQMDLEDESAEQFGVSRIDQFTWIQNLDLYACIECGRCQDFCPTANTGKPLKPKQLIVELKDHLVEHGPALLQAKAGGNGSGEAPAIPALVGEVITTDTIWACTTCGACVEHCPMGIEHVDKITDMRRQLVLMESNFPEQADLTFRNMETAGNPWGLPPAERAAWAAGLDVPILAEKGEADVLFWVGCSGSYDDRSREVSRAMVKILQAAGIDFAILGEEERCNCEAARRLGNEYLYQAATQEIIETLARYRFKRILTICPHCFNTFADEYPAFGAEFEVVHHATLIAELIDQGTLRLKDGAGRRMAFHDSCYLARYHGIIDAPRRAVAAAGHTMAAVEREGLKGFCCGAGGGRMWLEETIGEKINNERTKELLSVQPDAIGAACPFCITMLTDGVKMAGAETPVKDIAEIVAEALI
jgi:Fe-S oxidoreductase